MPTDVAAWTDTREPPTPDRAGRAHRAASERCEAPGGRTAPEGRAAGPGRGGSDDVGGRRREHVVLAVLGVLALASVVGFMTIGVTGSWAFALSLRVTKVAAMIAVGTAIAVSTSLFQTVTNNRILTPSIMGFDALFVLIQALGLFVFGSLTLNRVPDLAMFALEAGAMVGFALGLYRWLFRRHANDLFLLVLAGIVFGTLFRSGSELVIRLIDPNEFQTLQDRLFASFNSVDDGLLGVASVVVALGVAVAWRMRRHLDVVALGADVATTLGVDHRRIVTASLATMAVLVSVATALVGPMTFLGLLVVNLARQLLGTFRHGFVIPASVLVSIVMLAGGQLVLEEVLGFGTALGIVINLLGGATFLVLLYRQARA